MPGDSSEVQPFSGISGDETLYFSGTEPFWGGQASGDILTYTTPENPDGEQIVVKQFGGRGGMGLSGVREGEAFDMTITPGVCSDGMSD